AGPLNSFGVPVGGRSSLEAGAEFRWRFTETLGIVPFFDAGNVYPTNLPNRFSFFYSAGIGLRYYTAIGPIRLDLAFPIEKRPSDAPFQVYISIGQAF
ncbi:MAG: BamA/TamA family outer membrane protein, partial [Stellaceae bacterium]